MNLKNERGFLAYIALLLVVLIIGFLGQKVFQSYYHQPGSELKSMPETQVFLQNSGSSGPQSIVDSARREIEAANQKTLQHEDEIYNQMKAYR